MRPNVSKKLIVFTSMPTELFDLLVSIASAALLSFTGVDIIFVGINQLNTNLNVISDRVYFTTFNNYTEELSEFLYENICLYNPLRYTIPFEHNSNATSIITTTSTGTRAPVITTLYSNGTIGSSTKYTSPYKSASSPTTLFANSTTLTPTESTSLYTDTSTIETNTISNLDTTSKTSATKLNSTTKIITTTSTFPTQSSSKSTSFITTTYKSSASTHPSTSLSKQVSSTTSLIPHTISSTTTYATTSTEHTRLSTITSSVTTSSTSKPEKSSFSIIILLIIIAIFVLLLVIITFFLCRRFKIFSRIQSLQDNKPTHYNKLNDKISGKPTHQKININTSFNIEIDSETPPTYLTKLTNNKNVNKLFFANSSKQYYEFNYQELVDLGVIAATSRHVVRKYRHKPSNNIMAAKHLCIPHSRFEDEVIKEHFKVVLREIENFQNLRGCPEIVDFYGLCIYEGQALLCMELMDLSLRDLYLQVHKNNPQTFPEVILGYVFVVIVNALIFCKSKGIIHRDIKPSNILVNYSGEIKLCDFGESRILESSFASTQAGTLAYWPPERFNTIQSKYDIRSDIWSLGITLMEVVLGKLPYFSAPTKEEKEGAFTLQKYITITNFTQVIDRDIKSKYSYMLSDVLFQCVQQLERRPKLEQLISMEFYKQYKDISSDRISNILSFYKV